MGWKSVDIEGWVDLEFVVVFFVKDGCVEDVFLELWVVVGWFGEVLLLVVVKVGYCFDILD